jgi:CRP-like cAMP-binding protein
MALLEEAEREALFAPGVRRGFPRGSVLMFQHEPDERVMFLLAGRVKIGRVDKGGRELVLTLRDSGDVLGEVAFIDHGARVATVTALEPVETLTMPSNVFRAHLETTPRVAVALLDVVGRRYREETLRLGQFAALDTLGRVAARLVELADRYGHASNDGVALTMPLSQEDLAAWAGASRAGVADALRSLRELGWIRSERRELVLLDMPSLRARSE